MRKVHRSAGAAISFGCHHQRGAVRDLLTVRYSFKDTHRHVVLEILMHFMLPVKRYGSRLGAFHGYYRVLTHMKVQVRAFHRWELLVLALVER